MKQVLLYLPVIHAGYELFLSRHADADEILLLGDGFLAAHPSLAKDIRALPPQRAAACLRSIAGGASVRVVEPHDLAAAVTADVLVMPDEEVTRDLVSQYQLEHGRTVVFDRTFLRWDREWASARTPVRFDGEISAAELPRKLLGRAAAGPARSSDWWRQVGAVAARDHVVLGCAWNRDHPTEHAPYLNGDPRDSVERGVQAGLSTAVHAEAAVIAWAARDGISLAGADLYTTTFPCPACARLIVEAGFRRCFFAGQYSVLDGEQVLRAAGISLVGVDTGPASERRAADPASPAASHPGSLPAASRPGPRPAASWPLARPGDR